MPKFVSHAISKGTRNKRARIKRSLLSKSNHLKQAKKAIQVKKNLLNHARQGFI